MELPDPPSLYYSAIIALKQGAFIVHFNNNVVYVECEDGSLRLMDGTSPYDGRLEVCLAGVWGTICSYLWDRSDAMVACRQLGINATGMDGEEASQIDRYYIII